MSLVWGVREQGSPEELQRARNLFALLDHENANVVVPAVAIAEFVYPIDPADQSRVIADLADRFMIRPFDVSCCALAAQLWKLMRPNQKRVSGGRDLVKSDALIVACAKRHGASTFFSDDEDARDMASKVMTAKPLPDIGQSLFDYAGDH